MMPSMLKVSAPAVLIGFVVVALASAGPRAHESPPVRERSKVAAGVPQPDASVVLARRKRHRFAAGNWPSGRWRPYADDSPINKPLPANPRIHPNSPAYVDRLLSLGQI